MKKEIKALLEMEHGTLIINAITRLERSKGNIMGQDIDRLQVVFHSPTGTVYYHFEDIEERDIPGIVAHIQKANERFAAKWLDEENKKIGAGRWDLTLCDLDSL